MRLRATFWATATDRGSWGTSEKPPRKVCHRVPERACSSDHLMCTKNIKEKQKKISNTSEWILRDLQKGIQWRAINTR